MRKWHTVQLIAFVLILFSTTDEETCGVGWKRFQNSCYKLFITGKTWIDAKHACERRGANLVKIDSKDLKYFLSQSFMRLLNLRKSHLKPWCGLSRDSGNSLDTFRWLDQSLPKMDLWILYNKTLGWPYSGHCVVLQPNCGWITTECTHSQPYICQKGKKLIRFLRDTFFLFGLLWSFSFFVD